MFSYRKFSSIAVSLLTVLALHGCSGGDTSGPSPASGGTPVPPALTPVAEPAPVPAPAKPESAPQSPAVARNAKPNAATPPKAAPAYDASLIPNGSFEAKDDTGRPSGWIVSPPSIIVRDATGEAADGKSWLGLKGDKKNWGVIAADVKLAPELLGRDLRIVAFGKAPEDNKMNLALVCEVDGKETEVAKKYWAKTGDDWSKVEFTAAVPVAADPNKVRVRALLPQGSGEGYALDGIRIVVDLLGPNADFAASDENGRPNGWIASPSGLIATDAQLADNAGERAIALHPLETSWGLLAHNMTLADGDLGKPLVIAASGFAEEVNNLRIVVRGNVGGKETDLANEWWPKTHGQWKQIVLRVPLPKDLDPASAQVRLVLRKGAKGTYGVSGVQAGF